jgi:hypothetical protein
MEEWALRMPLKTRNSVDSQRMMMLPSSNQTCSLRTGPGASTLSITVSSSGRIDDFVDDDDAYTEGRDAPAEGLFKVLTMRAMIHVETVGG